MNDLAETQGAALVEKVVVGGDLSKLNAQERLQYYARVCESVGLNPLTRPFESMTLQQTNSWGEKIGTPVTFIEYLTARADAYMREEVDFEGKTKEEKCGYTFNKRGTRVAYMVDKHLHYSIEQAMKSALSQANSSIANGLAEACKTAINNVAATLKVQATYKS